MQTHTLNLQTLHMISKGLSDDFMQQLEAAILDCKQRPSLPAKREIKLTLTIIPHPEDPDDVLITPVTTSKTPARQVEPIRGRRTQRNGVQFDTPLFDDGELEA